MSHLKFHFSTPNRCKILEHVLCSKMYNMSLLCIKLGREKF